MQNIIYTIVYLIFAVSIIKTIIFIKKGDANKLLNSTKSRRRYERAMSVVIMKNHPTASIISLLLFLGMLTFVLLFTMFYKYLDKDILDFIYKYENYFIPIFILIVFISLIIFSFITKSKYNKKASNPLTIPCVNNVVNVEIIKEEFNYFAKILLNNNSQKTLTNIKIKINNIYLNNYDTNHYNQLNTTYDLNPYDSISLEYEFNLRKNKIDKKLQFTEEDNLVLEFTISYEFLGKELTFNYIYQLISNKTTYILKKEKINKIK